jgi:hypothetical protein
MGNSIELFPFPPAPTHTPFRESPRVKFGNVVYTNVLISLIAGIFPPVPAMALGLEKRARFRSPRR